MSDAPSSKDVLRIEVDDQGSVAIVRLAGSARMDVSGSLKDMLVELVDRPVDQLVLDLAHLDFISSVGLGAIIAAHLRCRHCRAVVKIAAPQPRIEELLRKTRLTSLFDIYPTVDQAIAAC